MVGTKNEGGGHHASFVCEGMHAFFAKAIGLGCSITSPPMPLRILFTLFSALWQPFKIGDWFQLLVPLCLHRFTFLSTLFTLHFMQSLLIERDPFLRENKPSSSCSLAVGWVEVAL